jgi:hypothetical protein
MGIDAFIVALRERAGEGSSPTNPMILEVRREF